MIKKIIPYLFILITAIFIASFIIACKKDSQNNTLPVVTVYSPPQNALYSVSDNISVYAEITDDKLITGVKVVLVDNNLTPVVEALYYSPNQKSFKLEDQYTISNVQLETGNYFLQFRADDEFDFKNEYIQIYIEGQPQELEQIVVLTQQGANHIKVSGVSNFETVTELFTIQGDYSASEVSSKHHKLFISGIEKINLRAYDLITNQLDWEKGIIPQWPMHNSDCMYSDELLYVTFDYRDIYGYNFSGIEKYNSQVGDFEAPGKIYKHKNFLLTDIQKKNGTIPFVSVFHTASGVEAQRLTTFFEVVDFFSWSDDVVLIIANTDGKGYIGEYNIINNILTDRFFAETQFLSSVGINSNNIYISTPGYIGLYTAGTNFLTPVLYKQGVKHMTYEKLSDLLMAATNNELLLLNLPEMTNQKTLLFSDSILNIHLLYSK